MANPFGGFCHTSPLASMDHDPAITLASNCIRNYFGPTVQTVADCLQSRGPCPSTFSQLVAAIRRQCFRPRNEERERLLSIACSAETGSESGATVTSLCDATTVINEHGGNDTNKNKYRLIRARGPAASGFVAEVEPIRQALIVLIQHGMVQVSVATTTHHSNRPSTSSTSSTAMPTTYTYRFLIHRARLLVRYPRFIEYAKKALDETAAALVEELLFHGRLTTVDAVVFTVARLQQLRTDAAVAVKTNRYTFRQAVVESFRRLVVGGFIEQVSPLQQKRTKNADQELEVEQHEDGARTGSSNFGAKMEHDQVMVSAGGDLAGAGGAMDTMMNVDNHYFHHAHQDDDDEDEDPAVVALLEQGAYKNVLPRKAVWQVNVDIFHESLRAFCLGRLVAERFGHQVQSAGSMITASLKLAAHRKHALKLKTYDQQTIFTPNEIVNYLPKPVVQQSLEKKPGGILKNLSSALVEMSRLTYPTVLFEIEDAAGHAQGGKFQIATRQLVDHLRDRIHHQVVFDSHGEVAARICSILIEKGHLEADAIAETAMVPAKDTREILHKLYRANYVDLFTLQQSKQHNPASMIYLWNVKKPRMQQTVSDNVCRAMTNIRLRRQHEESVGKDLIERAKESIDADVNEQEMDKANYTKFCVGLERLDNATLQLDETLMVLLDF